MEQILPFWLKGGIHNYQEKSESSPFNAVTCFLKCLWEFFAQKQIIVFVGVFFFSFLKLCIVL